MDQIFTVQYHVAEKAGPHYDLRLSDGERADSWALRYIPHEENEKRLAIKTPDHKESWIHFEGEILSGYGKGNVEVWDEGHYDIVYSKPGYYKLFLSGDKLVGYYNLRRWEKDKWLFWKSGIKESKEGESYD